MSVETQVAQHYTSGRLEDRLLQGLTLSGKDLSQLSVDDLGPVDEFHVGGVQSTRDLASRMNLKRSMRLLDVGCGIGGSARVIARDYQCDVDGIDLTKEFIEVGQKLTQMVGLEKSVHLYKGSALEMPFKSGSYDAAYTIHVGMNVADKAGVYREVRRVLKNGAVFALFDILRMKDGALTYPVPWADSADTSFVATLADYRNDLMAAGFHIESEQNKQTFAIQFTEQMMSRVSQGGPPALGLHLLMGEKTPLLMKNIVSMMRDGLLAPVEITARAA